MCGIVGYIGPKPVVPVLLEGLRRLEYRGYDSAGVAVVHNGDIEMRRSAGKLSISSSQSRPSRSTAIYGLGHTRWATHGRPTEENAHPHRDGTGRIVVVHNGIIENYLELKRELAAKGHKFQPRPTPKSSRTWSRRSGRTTASRTPCCARCSEFAGCSRSSLLSADDPEKIVAVRNGPPIVIGIGDGEFFVASDMPAILEHTRDVFFLDDREMAVVTAKGVRFTTLDGTDGRAANRQRVTWDPISGGKGRLQALHAQGDLSSSRAPCARRSLGRVSLDTGQVLPRRDGHLATTTFAQLNDDQDAGLRHLVARGAGRQVHDRAARAHPRRSRLRLRIPLSQSDHRRQHAGGRRSRSRARRPTRSRRCAKRKGTRRAQPVDLQRASAAMATREADGTIYTHAGPGDRRGLDQGVHHPNGRALPVRAVPRPRCAAR